MSEAPVSPFRSDILAGQVAFVTGGATGIGKEICRVLGQLYFCSPAARLISGQVIAVDGASTVDLLKLNLR